MEAGQIARAMLMLGTVALCAMGSARAAPEALWPRGEDPAAEWRLQSPPGAAVRTPLPAAPGLGEGGVRIEIKRMTDVPWRIQLSRDVAPAITANDHLRLRFRGRSATGSLLVAIMERASEPWTKFMDQGLALTPEWQSYALVTVIPTALPADFAAVRFRLGFGPGEVELADIRLESYGPNPDPKPAPLNLDYYGGQPHSDAWRAAAEARIRRIRMGGLEVVVEDEAGRPVKGARVTVEQQRHAFLFGTALADRPLLGDTPDALRYQEQVARLFNYAVLENALKWRGESRFRAQIADDMLDWCARHEIPVRGHVLFWPSRRNLPPEAAELQGDAVRAAIRDHITDYVSHYSPKLVAWDVINEAVSNHELTDELGRELLVDALRWARAAAPDIPLCYNDYSVLDDRAGAGANHRQAVRAVLDYLIKEERAPVDRIGLQGHMHLPLTPMDKVLKTLDQFAGYGKPLEITEFDVGPLDDEMQAEYLRDFMTAIFSHPAVHSFLMWGFWEGSHWRARDNAAIINRDWTLKPAAQAYQDLVFHQWWTRESGTTGAGGAWRTRAFLGRHLVTAIAGDRTGSAVVELDRPGDAVTRVEVRLGKSRQ